MIFDALLRVERRHALLGEVEMVRPVVEALLGFRVRTNDAALLSGSVASVVIEIGGAVADERQIARPAVHVESVHVDVGRCLRERVDRRDRVVLRAEQPLLLSRDRKKQRPTASAATAAW